MTDNKTQNNSSNIVTQPVPSGVHSSGKESEPAATSTDYIMEVGSEEEISSEVSSVGVISQPERIEIPPDLQQVGVTPVGGSVPLPNPPTLKLPIPDEQIEKGLHEKIWNSLRWLAEWCVFQLKKAHYRLKTINGKVIRVKSDK